MRILMIIAALIFTAQANAQDVLGKWKLEDGTAIVEVYKSGDCFNGKIVWLSTPNDSKGNPATDVNNPDPELKSRAILGLNMLSGLKFDGKEYSGGRIYDPNNGKTYYCSFKVNGDVLKVRGSLDKRGVLGRTMDWFRVK